MREYFADIPVMIEIARCESEFRQFDSRGRVLRGTLAPSMTGVFQIASRVHADVIADMNTDITTLKGNLEFARYLYTRDGTTPWNPSRTCWNAPKSAARWKSARAEYEKSKNTILSSSTSSQNQNVGTTIPDHSILTELHAQLTNALAQLVATSAIAMTPNKP